MNENHALEALRAQAWERAKAELMAIGQADFPPETATKEDYANWAQKCERRRQLMDRFITTMEEDELYR